jgi:hypothetical protein
MDKSIHIGASHPLVGKWWISGNEIETRVSRVVKNNVKAVTHRLSKKDGSWVWREKSWQRIGYRVGYPS